MATTAFYAVHACLDFKQSRITLADVISSPAVAVKSRARSFINFSDTEARHQSLGALFSSHHVFSLVFNSSLSHARTFLRLLPA